MVFSFLNRVIAIKSPKNKISRIKISENKETKIKAVMKYFLLFFGLEAIKHDKTLGKEKEERVIIKTIKGLIKPNNVMDSKDNEEVKAIFDSKEKPLEIRETSKILKKVFHKYFFVIFSLHS